MKKSKKIAVVLIAIVALMATFVISSSAYLVEEGTSQIRDVYVPSVTTTVPKTNGITQTPTAFGAPLSGGYYYRAGDAVNSVRVTVTDGGYYQDYNVDGRLHTSSQSGVLTFFMVSQNSFQFHMDFGDTLGAITSRFYPELTYGDNITPTLHISAKVGLFTDINSSGIAYGEYSSLRAFTDYIVQANYREGVDYYTSYLNRNETDNVFYNFYDGTDTQSVQSVNGYINNPMEDGTGYVMVAVQVSTYDGADFVNTPSYFDGTNTTISRMSHKYNTWVAETFYDAGQTGGYSNGYSDGYDEGYDEGIEKAIEDRGMFAFIIDSLEAFFSYPLFDLPNGGHITLALLLGVIVGALVFVWILKLIAGG